MNLTFAQVTPLAKRFLGIFATFAIAGNLTCNAVFCQEANADRAALTAEQVNFFESKIRPVLVRECYSCHSTQTGNAKGGLRLDTEQLCQLGGNSGPAVVPGDVEASLLMNAILYQDFEMPPNKQLADQVVADFRTWIEMGAPDPRKTEIAKLNSKISQQDIDEAKSSFWAYQPVRLPEVPTVNATDWVVNDIDRFIVSELEEHQLTPASDAESQVVLRRLTYDLTGLPPTGAQVRQFDSQWSNSPQQAIEQMAKLLLDSPQFGERWGRHWLDVARYAESNGREVNSTLPHAWRYRDYVIDSLNRDKPYDQFVKEQIAGDLIPAKSDEEWAEHLVATGFLALGPKPLSERNRVQFIADVVDEQLDVTTRVMLGTSIACARCHDHKFDPIPQSDYYALAGIFASTATYFGAPASQFGLVGGQPNRQKSNLLRLPIQDPNPFDKSYEPEELAEMEEELQEARQSLVELRMNRNDPNASSAAIRNLARTQSRMEYLSNAIGSVDKTGRPISYCMGVQDSESPRDVRVLIRGEVDQPADVAARGIPKVLSDTPLSIKNGASGRRELAEWISSPSNPLTARVMVNRIWQHLLGRGIVSTPEDFGSTGDRPSHPELLDYLAIQFIDCGWSTKTIIRKIVTSHTYRISSQMNPVAFELDPDNELHWRANPRRLDAEEMRDSMLAAAGQLDLHRPRASEIAKVGFMQVRDGNLINPSQFSNMENDGDMRREVARQMMEQAGVNPRQLAQQMRNRRPEERANRTAGLLSAMANGSERIDMVQANYRSVYLPVLRDQLPRTLEVFDFAEPSMVVGQRESSNTPNQALFMLNNDLVMRLSESLANRVAEEAKSPNKWTEKAYELVFHRLPNDEERQAVNRFVRDFGKQSNTQDRGKSTLVALCQSLMASAEFRFID